MKAQKVIREYFIKGDPQAQKPWVTRVIDQTLGLPRISGSCELEVEFVLPVDRAPWVLLSETTLDNLLKQLLDALEGTVLREQDHRFSGEDGSLVAIHARKRVATPREKTGTHLVLRRAKVPA